MSQDAELTETNIRWLKPDQVEAMRDATHEGRHGPRDDAIVTILYDTGLRRGELAGIDREMLDLDEVHNPSDPTSLPHDRYSTSLTGTDTTSCASRKGNRVADVRNRPQCGSAGERAIRIVIPVIGWDSRGFRR